ncbi:MAG: hypothetical protein ACI35O_15025 [Bacillaceae bacterium]
MNTIGGQLLLILFIILTICGFVGIFHYILRMAEESEIENIPKRNK